MLEDKIFLDILRDSLNNFFKQFAEIKYLWYNYVIVKFYIFFCLIVYNLKHTNVLWTEKKRF